MSKSPAGDLLSGLINLGSSGKQTPSWWAWLMGAISGTSYPKADPAGLLAGAGALRQAAGFVNDRVLAVERATAGAGVVMPGAGAMTASTLTGVGANARDGAQTLDEGATALEEQAREIDRAQLMMGFTAAITLWTVAQLAWAIAATGGTSAALVPTVMAGGRRSVSEIVAELLVAMRSGALFGLGQDAFVQGIEAAKYRQGLDATSLLISAVGGLAGGIGDVAGRGLGEHLIGPDLLRKTAGGALGGAIGGEAGTVISTAWQGGPWDPTAFALAAAAGGGTGAIGGATHHYTQTKHHSALPPHATPETPTPHTETNTEESPTTNTATNTATNADTGQAHPGEHPAAGNTPRRGTVGAGEETGRGQDPVPVAGDHQAGEPAPEPLPAPATSSTEVSEAAPSPLSPHNTPAPTAPAPTHHQSAFETEPTSRHTPTPQPAHQPTPPAPTHAHPDTDTTTPQHPTDHPTERPGSTPHTTPDQHATTTNTTGTAGTGDGEPLSPSSPPRAHSRAQPFVRARRLAQPRAELARSRRKRPGTPTGT
ncbi:hypothetical protein [Kitasatospora sp. NPDC093102]|uniref:hypothetical protein n=1 Tax=Kitasatospora sp. NPDC093102 TaxID=3155069 RepID=UPI00343B9CD2